MGYMAVREHGTPYSQRLMTMAIKEHGRPFDKCSIN